MNGGEADLATAFARLHGSFATETWMRADTTYVWGILPTLPVSEDEVRERVTVRTVRWREQHPT